MPRKVGTARIQMRVSMGRENDAFEDLIPVRILVSPETAAVAEFGRLRFTGFVAGMLWLVVHLINLISFRNRLLVLWGHGELFFPSVAPPPAVPAADGPTVQSAEPSASVPAADELVAELTPEHSVMGAVDEQPAAPDIIGYDACRMATVSNVQTLANALPEAVFIGSMVPEPASGWPYVQLLRALREPAGPKAVAAAIVEAYAASVDAPDWCLVAVRGTGDAFVDGDRSDTNTNLDEYSRFTFRSRCSSSPLTG